MSGIVGATPSIIGEPYSDADRNEYHALTVQPVVVLAADAPTLKLVHGRALARNIKYALYVEEMFATGHDDANRAAFAEFSPDTAKVVGLALGAERKTVDKITKDARMHP